jgi:hypothetical protein
MPFNLKSFRKRALTAIVFVAVMAIGMLWDQWTFFLLFSVIHFGCWIEYQKLVTRFFPGLREDQRLPSLWGDDSRVVADAFLFGKRVDAG